MGISKNKPNGILIASCEWKSHNLKKTHYIASLYTPTVQMDDGSDRHCEIYLNTNKSNNKIVDDERFLFHLSD